MSQTSTYRRWCMMVHIKILLHAAAGGFHAFSHHHENMSICAAFSGIVKDNHIMIHLSLLWQIMGWEGRWSPWRPENTLHPFQFLLNSIGIKCPFTYIWLASFNGCCFVYGEMKVVCYPLNLNWGRQSFRAKSIFIKIYSLICILWNCFVVLKVKQRCD